MVSTAVRLCASKCNIDRAGSTRGILLAKISTSTAIILFGFLPGTRLPGPVVLPGPGVVTLTIGAFLHACGISIGWRCLHQAGINLSRRVIDYLRIHVIRWPFDDTGISRRRHDNGSRINWCLLGRCLRKCMDANCKEHCADLNVQHFQSVADIA